MVISASLPLSQACSPALGFSNPDSGIKQMYSTKEGNHDETMQPIPGRSNVHQNNASQSGAETRSSSPSEAHSDILPRVENLNEKRPREDVHNTTRSFRLYGQMKSTHEVNEAIKVELLKSHPSSEGFIYGFLLPIDSRVRIGTGPCSNIHIIKIGRSVDVKGRMREWKEQCKYEPLVVFNTNMPHHHRIERIVHHQLHNTRLREYPGCSGCSLQHNEWFRVSAIYAVHVVSLWQDFARRRPYGEEGHLLPGWLEKLEQIDLEDPGCWMWFILGSPLIGTVSLVDDGEEHHNGSRNPSSCPSTKEAVDRSVQTIVNNSSFRGPYPTANSSFYKLSGPAELLPGQYASEYIHRVALAVCVPVPRVDCKVSTQCS